MKFGFVVSRKLIDRASSDPYAQVYSYAREMEDLGYDIGYVGQHRFSDVTAMGGDSASEPSAPLIMVSGILARTTHLRMCTNIMLLPAHHPVEIAEEINTLNELSNKRFVLGAGIGYKADEFHNVGWDFKTRARRFEECLAILRLALSGEEFTYSGSFFKLGPLKVVPTPMPGPPMPLWIGAVSEPAMRRAGRLGDGWLISFAEHLLELQRKIAQYKAIASEHKRPSTICLMRDLHIAPTKREVDQGWLKNVIRVWQAYDTLGSKADRDAVANQVMFGGKQVALEDFVPNRALVGTPDDCAREMERIKKLVNPDYVLMTPTGVPDSKQHWKELRLFAKEVMPHFAK
jgi:alkanesulfonate monooxygenase SsuD/methylene tetrahydromethanopterin reductase-like flavin-dependent oxidoreductase (luciferase family)